MIIDLQEKPPLLEQAYAYLPLYTVLIWHFEKFSRADYRADALRFSFSNDMNFIHAEGAPARMKFCFNNIAALRQTNLKL